VDKRIGRSLSVLRLAWDSNLKDEQCPDLKGDEWIFNLQPHCRIRDPATCLDPSTDMLSVKD